MKIKITESFLISAMLMNAMSITPIAANADGIMTEGQYTYSVTSDIATITDVDESISGDITVPSTLGGYPVRAIDKGAFENCDSITEVSISEGISSIGEDAFCDCDSLESAYIPSSVTFIGDGAFCICVNLKSINVDENNSHYTSHDGNLFTKDKAAFMQYAIGKPETSYTIPDGVISIRDSSFSCAEHLTDISIPSGVEYIGESAFSDCVNLTELYLPNSVRLIGGWAFLSCVNLTSITFSINVNTIENGVFYDCTSLKTLYYPDSSRSWDDIKINGYNEILDNVNIIFGSDGKAPEIITSFGSKVSEWAAPEIETAFENGLIPEVMVGYDLTKKVNRGEFAAIALQLYETLIDSYVELPENCAFTDINGDINEEAIKKAYEMQIAAGMSDNQYMPLEFINREQLATMLCRVIKKRWFNGWTLANDDEYYLDTEGVNLFSDDADISSWAKPSVYYMTRHGIIAGVGDNVFAPRQTESQQHIADYASATREQALVLSLRIFNKSENENWQ